MARILIVDSDSSRARVVAESLVRAGHSQGQVAGAGSACEELEASAWDLVVAAEPNLPETRSFIEQVATRWPDLSVVTVAGSDPASNAEDALRLGAADSLSTPVVPEEVVFVVNKALSAASLAGTRPPRVAPRVSGLVGETEPMQALRERLRRAAAGTVTTLVRGETGTGKELVARALHAQSPRHDRNLVKIDCASLPDNLLESELFGYEKGAFTGAVTRKPGRIELAAGGTLFLDEIGELSLPLQAKLLRLLQHREFERLGGRVTQRVDTRFVLATHRDLETMVENGTFREDLFHRINVVSLWLPPLRARRDDIASLAREFVAGFCAAAGKPPFDIAPEALRKLRSQRWPGNVRQLENLMERLVVLSDGPVIRLSDVERELAPKPQFQTQHTETAGSIAEHEPTGGLSEAVRRAEKSALLAALERTGGNRSVAARVLGVSRATLYNKLREYGVP